MMNMNRWAQHEELHPFIKSCWCGYVANCLFNCRTFAGWGYLMYLPMQPGAETQERVTLLLRLANKLSDNTKLALKKHLVNGWDVDTVCNCFDMKQPNFSRALKTLNEVNYVVEQIKDYDLYRVNDMKKTINLRLTQ